MHSFDADLQADAVGSVMYNAAPPDYDWSDVSHWQGCTFDTVSAEATAAYANDTPDEHSGAPSSLPAAAPAFNHLQAAAYSIVIEHCRAMQQSSHRRRPDPLRLIISGEGRCGKTFVIHHISAALQAILNCDAALLVLAPTCAAAEQEAGETLHRGACIRVTMTFSNGAALVRVRSRLRWCKYLVLDERSMIAQKFFECIERRIVDLLPAEDCSAQTWGGLWGVILVGDDGQLQPVNGYPHYDDLSTASPEDMHWLALYRQFTAVVELTANVRAQDDTSSLASILNSLSRGELSRADLNVLNSRALGLLPPAEAASCAADDVQVLVTLNADRIQRNLDQIAATPGPIAEIAAEDAGCAKHLGSSNSPTLFSRLQPLL